MRKGDSHKPSSTISPAILAAIAAKLEDQMNSFSTTNTKDPNRQPLIPEDFTKDDILQIAFRAHLPVEASDSRQTLVDQLTNLLSPEALQAQVERIQKQKAQQ